MYIRPVHAELDVPTLQAFVKEHPLGLFTTAIKHPSIATIQTSHVPFIIDASTDGSPGVLRAHMARANPQAKVLVEASREAGGAQLPDEVLVLFNAPVNSYITPKFYTTTKPDTGKVVPTWSYAAVQVYGKIKVYGQNDEAAGEFLSKQIRDLTTQQETTAGHDKPWVVEDAPERYVALLQKAIIGFEIEIDRIEGRFKLSQELGQGDWDGVVEGFKGLGTADGDTMAKMMETMGAPRG